MDLMRSLEGTSYPVVILANDCLNCPRPFVAYLESLRSNSVKVIFKERDGYDPQLLEVMYVDTNYDEWMFLHDTVLIKKLELFNLCFDAYSGRSVSLFPLFLNFVGKYTRHDLEKVLLPSVSSKFEAISVETQWLPLYFKHINAKHLFEDNEGSNEITISLIEKHGREVMVLENGYFAKYKHSWSSIQEAFFQRVRFARAELNI